MKPLRLLTLAAALALAACGGDDPASLVASAKQYIDKGDYRASIIQLKNALQKQPENREARYLLGYASLESGDLVSAEVELGKAMDMGLVSDEVHVALARTLLAKGDAAGLLKRLGAVRLSAPQHQAELRALVGMAELMRGRRSEGEQALREALALDAANYSANLGAARLAAGAGDLKGALARVDIALKTAPSRQEAHIFRGDVLMALGQHDAAFKAFRAAIEVSPSEPGPRLSLISHLLRQRALDAAVAEVTALEKVAPRDVRTSYAKALLLGEQRKFPEAREAILQVLKVAPEHVPSLTLAGMAAFHTGAYTEAESHLRKAVYNAPQAIGAKRMLAATHLRMGQTELALSALRELLTEAGTDPNVLALAGEAHLATGDVAGATRYYEQARKVTPDSARVLTRLAQIRFAAGDASKGFAELEAVSANHPDDYQADLALIAAHLRQRQADKALEAVQRLETKQPSNPMTHQLKGVALLIKGDLKSARASFEHAVQLNPLYMPAVNDLVRMDLREKNTEAAKQRYEAVLKKQPNNEQALIGMAVLLRLTGAGAEEIEKRLRQAIAANPASPTARAALVNYYLRTRDAKSALTAAQEGVAALPNHAGMVEALGVTQLAAGEHRQAIATLTRLAELQPKSPQPHMLLARAQLAAKRPDEAIKALRAALELQPDLPGAQRDIASIYVNTGRAEQAVREARAVQKDKPKQPFGYVLEGEIHVAQKNWEAAERLYRDALKRFDLPLIAARVHAVVAATGREKEADGFAEQWVRSHPQDVFVLNYLAERDLLHKRYPEAARHYETALQRAPDNALLLNNLAWVSHQLKQNRALEYAEKAHDLAPDNPAIMDTLGGILAAKGETERGLELLGRAAELAPTAYQIRLNFAKALIAANRKGAARKELETLARLDSKLPVQQEASKLLLTL